MKTVIYNKHACVSVIGGGASGLFLAKRLAEYGIQTRVYERADRLGKKLSATGNGQGNVTNRDVTTAQYFSACADTQFINETIAKYDDKRLFAEFASLGVLLFFDERGRAYPTCRQASALTDVLRFNLQEKGVETALSTFVQSVRKENDGFVLTVQTPDGNREEYANYVVFCTGGKAQKNFGTDGSAYACIQSLGHTITKTYPSLVQLKTDVQYTKALRGIRVADAGLSATYSRNGIEQRTALRGDVIFTEYGISGDATFRISAFLTDVLDKETTVYIDFLPDFTIEQIEKAVQSKRAELPNLDPAESFCGIVNNQIGRAIMKRAQGDMKKAIALVKSFPLKITGTLGFDYAQVTKGGVPLSEVSSGLRSRLVDGVYFAGETLDVDGQCGGFNLHWAFASACAVADDIAKREGKA